MELHWSTRFVSTAFSFPCQPEVPSKMTPISIYTHTTSRGLKKLTGIAIDYRVRPSIALVHALFGTSSFQLNFGFVEAIACPLRSKPNKNQELLTSPLVRNNHIKKCCFITVTISKKGDKPVSPWQAQL